MSADGDIVRAAFFDCYLYADADQSWLEERRGELEAALVRLEAAQVKWDAFAVAPLQDEVRAAKAQRDALAKPIADWLPDMDDDMQQAFRAALYEAGLR